LSTAFVASSTVLVTLSTVFWTGAAATGGSLLVTLDAVCCAASVIGLVAVVAAPDAALAPLPALGADALPLVAVDVLLVVGAEPELLWRLWWAARW
jgi:hypothetical protein